MRLRQIRQGVEAGRKPAKLAGLNKSQMPLRQLDGLIAGIAPKTRMPVSSKPARARRSCLGLPTQFKITPAISTPGRSPRSRAQPPPPSATGRKCRAPGQRAGRRVPRYRHSLHPPLPGGSDAVEQPHERFDNNEVRALGLAQQRQRGFLPHRPAVEVIAWTPASRLVKGRIDIVRAAFERLDAEAAALERPQKPER